MKTSFCAGLAVAVLMGLRAEAAVIYANDFNQEEIGQVPDDCLVLDGQFAVREFGGSRVLELPGSPLDTYGVLFGASARDDFAVSARIHGTRTGRRFPVFAVSLGGVSGFRLQVTPAKRALELLQGEQAVRSVPWNWESGTWVHLRLQIDRVGEKEWSVRGRAWQEGASEPEEWTVAHSQAQAPISGKAGIWGKPFSGTPIRFDDVRVETSRS